MTDTDIDRRLRSAVAALYWILDADTDEDGRMGEIAIEAHNAIIDATGCIPTPKTLR